MDCPQPLLWAYREHVRRDSSLAELRKFFDEGQIVELTLVICAANFTNRFNDALRAVPDLGG